MRDIKYDPKYKSYTADFREKHRHIKNYIKRLDKDFEKVSALLANDQPIPPKYKNHKVGEDEFGNHIRDIHLVARGSDCILLYKKYDNTLYFYAITDHDGMNKILHGSVLLIDLPEETVDMILAGKLDY